jgi:diaminohydroxyphosphoribosylaminopyrimidine deaminase/5-amino-6-(5-phosphoribosylamino)uracil reductase
VNPKLESEFRNLGIEIVKMASPNISIPEMLKVIGEKGITSLFVEGGSEVQGSFLKDRAFQQVIAYIAPKLIGGKLAPASFGGEGIEKIADTVQLTFKEVELVGNDIRIIAEPI